MEQSQEHKTAATSLHYTYSFEFFYYIIYHEVVHTDIFFGIFGIVSSIILFLYFIIQPYKPKYAVYNKVTLTMITAVVLTMLSAVNVVIAYVPSSQFVYCTLRYLRPCASIVHNMYSNELDRNWQFLTSTKTPNYEHIQVSSFI